MNKLFVTSILALVMVGAARASEPSPSPVPNFSLLDLNGRYHEFLRSPGKVQVLYFTSKNCPVTRENASNLRELRKKFRNQGVEFWVIYAGNEENNDQIRRLASKLGLQSFPILRDRDGAVALALGVKRTGEVLAIERESSQVLYHAGLEHKKDHGEEKTGLSSALEAYLNGRKVTFTGGNSSGRELSLGNEQVSITYVNHVAPILLKKCANCHSKGNIGPFAYDSYTRARNKARTMEEVLLTRRMPPWHADSHFGKFQNDRSLTAEEMQTLIRWVQTGMPRGEGQDPLAGQTTPALEWPLGKPDFILKLPAAEKIPPSGVLEYRHVQLGNPIGQDAWLGAIAIKPGNRKVVHHVILRAQYPEAQDDGSGRGIMISGWAPGYFPERYPVDCGRFLPGNATFDVELHYNTVGTEQTDETEIGLYLLPQKPRLEFKVHAALNMDFSIPPGEADARTFATYGFQKDALLFALSPHMHLRGSWFKFEALYPDGRKETLLSVPRYDFNWQTEYRFERPMRMPKGTWILCTGAFDNSPQNPSNPDSQQRVTWGDQSFEEMFIGFMDIAEIPEGTAAD